MSLLKMWSSQKKQKQTKNLWQIIYKSKATEHSKITAKHTQSHKYLQSCKPSGPCVKWDGCWKVSAVSCRLQFSTNHLPSETSLTVKKRKVRGGKWIQVLQVKGRRTDECPSTCLMLVLLRWCIMAILSQIKNWVGVQYT